MFQLTFLTQKENFFSLVFLSLPSCKQSSGLRMIDKKGFSRCCHAALAWGNTPLSIFGHIEMNNDQRTGRDTDTDTLLRQKERVSSRLLNIMKLSFFSVQPWGRKNPLDLRFFWNCFWQIGETFFSIPFFQLSSHFYCCSITPRIWKNHIFLIGLDRRTRGEWE